MANFVEGSGISTNDRNFGNLIKEQQLELQKQSIVLAQDHKSKAYQLEQKLRKEQESYKSLEVRLKELEESKDLLKENAVKALMRQV